MSREYCPTCGVQLWLNGACAACPPDDELSLRRRKRLSQVFCPCCLLRWETYAAILDPEGQTCERCGTLSEPVWSVDDAECWAKDPRAV